MLALCAQYQFRAVGSRMNSTVGDALGVAPAASWPTVSASASQLAQQALVDRPPPRTAGARTVQWPQQTATQLPSHEGDRGTAVGQVGHRVAGRSAVEPAHQSETGVRIVANLAHLRQGEFCRRRHQAILPDSTDDANRAGKEQIELDGPGRTDADADRNRS